MEFWPQQLQTPDDKKDAKPLLLAATPVTAVRTISRSTIPRGFDTVVIALEDFRRIGSP